MLHKIALIFALAAVITGAAHAQVRIINGGGKSLSDLKASETYITIQLKDSNARDENLRIRTIGTDFLGVWDINGQPHSFPFTIIKEVRVQPGIVEERGIADSRTGRLSSDDRNVGERAIQRAYEIFENNKDDGQILMQAAAIMAANNGPNKQNAAAFLSARAGSNDLATAVASSLGIYIAGYDPDVQVIANGLSSGVRRTRAEAALLVGLTGQEDLGRDLVLMLRDAVPEVFPSAAVSLAMLGHNEILPTLTAALTGLNEAKADGAIEALIILGGDEVKSSMRDFVETGRGSQRFRALRVLYALGDEEAAKLLAPVNLNEPAFLVDAAILLCRDGDWEANLFLREDLESTKDPNKENLVQRARVATALFEGGHVPAKAALQDLLRMTPDEVYARGRDSDENYKKEAIVAAHIAVCDEILRSGVRSLMSILKPAIESDSPQVAIAACEAAVGMANPGYRERILAVRRAQ